MARYRDGSYVGKGEGRGEGGEEGRVRDAVVYV